ncbi:MAG: putative metalloprotease CJM1_0395 family protein, partial [Myxococcota bacterium]
MVAPLGGPKLDGPLIAPLEGARTPLRNKVEGYRRVVEAEATLLADAPREVLSAEERYPADIVAAGRAAQAEGRAGRGPDVEAPASPELPAGASEDAPELLSGPELPGADRVEDGEAPELWTGPELPGAKQAEGRADALLSGPELPGAEGELQDKRERAIEPNEATKRNKRTEGATDSVQEPVNAAEVERLRQRDREVRNHELAHAAAAGPYGGPPRYELERGPDGTMYATGGNVRIDVSPVPGDPDATIRKMRQVRRAALAPAEPSAQDRRVAARAAAEEAKARSALRRTQAQERGAR